MTKEKTAGGSRFQFLIFGLLLLILIIWANRKCTRSQNEFAQERRAEELQQQRLDSLEDAAVQAAAAAPSQGSSPSNVHRDTIQGGQMQIIREKSTPLYVTINNLAMRKGPGLKYEILDRLPLYAEVNFMNEVSDSIYTIKLGSITPSEPWVKIMNQKGREGWVFGAGVDFYKYKLEGVE